MAKQIEEDGKGKVQFNDVELDALRRIVTDWINEQVVAPPYPPEVASVIEKLGAADDEALAAGQAQEVVPPVQMDTTSSQQ